MKEEYDVVIPNDKRLAIAEELRINSKTANKCENLTYPWSDDLDEFKSSSELLRDDDDYITVTQDNKEYKFIQHGSDNFLPYHLLQLINDDDVMSSNKFFNILTCYGSGIQFMDKSTQEVSTLDEIEEFKMRNNLPMTFAQQATDMKMLFFCTTLFVLSKDYSKIVQLRAVDSCHVRFEKHNELGISDHIFVSNWATSDKIIEYPLLDFFDPLGDLEKKVALEKNKKGQKSYIFALVNKFPTPNRPYYPTPYYTALFRGKWYDIKHLSEEGKVSMLKNHSPMRYHVEINDRYWLDEKRKRNLNADELKRFIEDTKQSINDFLSGSENSGKLLVSDFKTTPEGKDISYIKINVIDTAKPGGEYNEETQESASIMCYCDSVHPNLIGATPGKTQSNNSGSDKRELFTLKQSLEKAPHDLMLQPYQLILHFNKWNKQTYMSIPMITLTTLDKNMDATMTTASDDTQI